MDDKTILNLYKSLQNNADFESNPLNRREIPSILQKNKRRSKKDKTGRNYICGCGKNYLSYPALYTHIKNKHGGVAPENTTLQPQSRVKPGRPPKRSDSPFKKAEGQDNSDNEDDGDQSGKMSDTKSRTSNQNEFTPMKNTDNFRSFEQGGFLFKKEMLDIKDLELISDLKCEGKASPTASFLKERNLITNQLKLHPLAEIVHALRNDTVEEGFFRQMTCDKIFGVYLYNLSQIASQEFLDMVALLLRALRQCLNDKGYELLQLFEAENPTQKIELQKESSDSGENIPFCRIEPAWYISIVYDYFVREYLGKYLEGTEFSLDFVCAFLQQFNAWLLKYNLSRIQCTFFSFYN